MFHLVNNVGALEFSLVLVEHAGDAGDMQEAVDQYSSAANPGLSPVADYNFGVFLAFGALLIPTEKGA
eukprot:IDg1312t1